MQKGFTLIELLFGIALLAVLVGFAAPNFQHLVNSQKQTSLLNQIMAEFQLARHEAIVQKSVISVCPLTANNCHDNWQQGFTVFVDYNGNRMLDGEDTQISEVAVPEDFYLNWSGFGSKRAIQFGPQGRTNRTAQNGTLSFCVEGQGNRGANVLVINRQGRIWAGTDSNQDSLIDQNTDRQAKCSTTG